MDLGSSVQEAHWYLHHDNIVEGCIDGLGSYLQLSVPTPFPEILCHPHLMANIPNQFYMKMCEIVSLRAYFKILNTRGCFFLTIWFCLWSNVPLFVFEFSYIFHTFENMKFLTFFWLFDRFPNTSRLCQPIPYLFKALKKSNLIPDFFKIFPNHGNSAVEGCNDGLGQHLQFRDVFMD